MRSYRNMTYALSLIMPVVGCRHLNMTGPMTDVVRSPKVLPNGCVDTSSLDGIVKGLCKSGMSDQEKVLAIYHWWRRQVFHFRNMGQDRRDVLRVINSYGYNMCGSHSGAMMVLFKHAGIKARPAFVVGAGSDEGYGGHTVEEVFYDGKWHCFDVMTDFCVLNRDNPPTIASLTELQADSTLVTKTEEEGRTVGGFLTDRHNPDLHYGNRHLFKKLGWGGSFKGNRYSCDLRWATVAFGYTDDEDQDHPGDMLTFWTKAPEKWSCLEAGDLYGGEHHPGLLDITLKPGERWVRLWDDVGKWASESSYPETGPFMTSGHTSEHDNVNFKYFEPYVRRNFNFTKTCYRYYANGYLEWKPRFVAELETGTRISGFQVSADGHRLAGEGKIAIPVKVPGPTVEIELDLVLKQTGKGARTTVTMVDNKKHVTECWSKAGPAKGLQNIIIPYQPRTKPQPTIFDYSLFIKTEGDVDLTVTRLKTIYQLNMYALPSLVPGKNIVRVSAETDRIENGELAVRYEWNDGDGWKKKRKVVKMFTEFPAEFAVNVAGSKMPRMRRIELSLGQQ